MREPQFIKQNKEKWEKIESTIQNRSDISADTYASYFLELLNDLSFARTKFKHSALVNYLNSLASKIHHKIYISKKEKSNRWKTFWTDELPRLMSKSKGALLLSFTIFAFGVFIGVISASQDESFVQFILGRDYVHRTLDNIDKGDPLAIYKSMKQTEMFFGIAINNIRVSFLAFVFGIFTAFGTGYILFSNGVMLGSFQYFFYKKGLFVTSILGVWIHGTIEISVIIIAGAAGIILGNSILFPKTYSRLDSFKSGAAKGLQIVIGLIPLFVIAAFLEGFVTRYYQELGYFSLIIILGSLAFIIYYFILYPNIKTRKVNERENQLI